MLKQVDIFPIYDRAVSRGFKEKILGQNAGVYWLTGLSGSGKSTVALMVEKKLSEKGRLVAFLDGDDVRDGLCKDLGFGPEDRRENIRRIAEVAKLFVRNGIIVLCTFISPAEEMRKLAAETVGSEDFHLIYVKAGVEVCKDRDPKGLYERAIRGEIKNFTGVSAPFDIPKNPQLILDTEHSSPEESAEILYRYINNNITV